MGIKGGESGELGKTENMTVICTKHTRRERDVAGRGNQGFCRRAFIVWMTDQNP